ncbi:hypothetical protein D9758_006786 [Tetrapyrgos nigripes]|uniref:AAA+ ATPase domain-containing protein n=1 Tax=Tetrapyrgos nigripes TaxID=182062 RepID=A0A8H5FU15_9AGAR|nr:hypothetical protein D9758_006786 [Tetrapyrgos nigripes]
MQTPRTTRSSVLGKRAHQPDPISFCDQLQTPEPTPNPKRPRTSSTVLDGDWNKENVPPFNLVPVSGDASPVRSRTRAIRRNTTEVITPPRVQDSLRRRASGSNLPDISTPTTGFSHLTLSTPPPTPPSLLPLHVRVRAVLRSTCNDTNSLPGRDKERAIISEFLTNFLDSSANNECFSLYVSGTPGSGKTALVNSVLSAFESEADDVKIITVNCMALKDIEALWERVIEELDGLRKRKSSGRSKKSKTRDSLEEVIKAMNTKCVLLLDELDNIVQASQSTTALLSLPISASSKLRVIGIANTHTLTTSASPSSSVRTLHFAPYASTQLLQILQSRLAPLRTEGSGEASESLDKLLPVSSLTLLSKKIAALTGDVRCLFEVLRGSIDQAVSTGSKTSDLMQAPAYSVTPAHVLAALKIYSPSVSSTTKASSSEIVVKIQSLGLQARLMLLSILLASKRLEAGMSISTSSAPVKRSMSTSNIGSSSGIDRTQLHGYYTTTLSRGGSNICQPVSRNEFGDLINLLEGVGLVNGGSAGDISPTKGKRTFARSNSFVGTSKGSSGSIKLGAGILTEEVVRGLGVEAEDTETPQDVREEEVRAIWRRESTRLAKDLKIAATKAAKRDGALFEDANED